MFQVIKSLSLKKFSKSVSKPLHNFLIVTIPEFNYHLLAYFTVEGVTPEMFIRELTVIFRSLHKSNKHFETTKVIYDISCSSDIKKASPKKISHQN